MPALVLRRSLGCAPLLAVLALVGSTSPVGASGAARESEVAALQGALVRAGVYGGPIDGVDGRRTAAAVRRFQVRRHLAVDGIVGKETRRALGRFARHTLGSRLLSRGRIGSDVVELQFELAWAGFPSGELDGRFGLHVEGALRRFQRWRGLPVDGAAGARTLAALREPAPRPSIRLGWPVAGAVIGSRFGPRGLRFHAGVDLVVPRGAPVGAAAPGRVVWAGERGAWGLLVTVAHGGGVRTLYAHLSRISVRVGEQVAAGALLGLVGATGDATGPHLHFEVRLRGAAVDPVPLLSER